MTLRHSVALMPNQELVKRPPFHLRDKRWDTCYGLHSNGNLNRKVGLSSSSECFQSEALARQLEKDGDVQIYNFDHGLEGNCGWVNSMKQLNNVPAGTKCGYNM